MWGVVCYTLGMETGVKQCLRCKETKDLSLFYRLKHGKLGRQSQCIDCKKSVYSENRELFLQDIRDRNQRIKVEVFSNLCSGAPHCTCPGDCPVTDIEFLTVDHANGDGNKHKKQNNLSGGVSLYRWIKRNHCPKGFRVLCLNCNFSMGKFGYCPHLREMAIREIDY